MSSPRFLVCALSAVLFTVSASEVQAQQVQLELVDARIEEGKAVVRGTAEGLPDGAMIRIELSLSGGHPLRGKARAKAGEFEARFGRGSEKFLPAEYTFTVSLLKRGQPRGMKEKLKGVQVSEGGGTVRVGTLEEEAAERRDLKQRYLHQLSSMREIDRQLQSRGVILIRRAETEKLNNGGMVSPEQQDAIRASWGEVSQVAETSFPALKAERLAINKAFVFGYWPNVDSLLGELGVSLERKHAALTIAIYQKLGLKPPSWTKAVGKFSITNINGHLPVLASRLYKELGAENAWGGDGEDGQRPAPAVPEGDTFSSDEAGFEISKPGPEWVFDPRRSSATRWLRIRSADRALSRTVAAGIDVREFRAAENLEDLARLDENAARVQWPGFKRLESETLSVDDPNAPDGKRAGQLLTFTFKAGGKEFKALQYSLFSSDHKKVYSVVSFCLIETYSKFAKTFRGFNKSFKVLSD